MQTQNGISRGKAIYKVPGGKLIKVGLGVRKGRIAEIRITGDFFMHPEDAIEELEVALIGTRLENEDLEQGVNALLARGVEIIGLEAADIVVSILSAHESIKPHP
jgi:lipoate-protein ligase A